jgi:hypothetical protein
MEMKKKITKKKKPVKQKIDVVLESLVNLEQKVKELIKEVENLKNKDHHRYIPPSQPVPMPTYPPEPKYWPYMYHPHKYDYVTWTDNTK